MAGADVSVGNCKYLLNQQTLVHPDGVLRKENFVWIKANWNSKDQNLKEIGEELSLGMDNFVFVDDNPVERELVKRQLPEVETPDIDSSENFIKMLDHNGYFEVTVFSSEDRNKTAQYHARARVTNAKTCFANYDEYLASLDMKAIITQFEPIYIQRVVQLTNKSNQFDLTTLRCSEDDIMAMQRDEKFICLCGRLIDKFSDNGIVSVVVGKIENKQINIRIWLMSCRVLKRGLEKAMMNILISVAKDRGIKEVVGNYYPTKKNGMVKDFYKEMGFSFMSQDEKGNSKWKMEVDGYSFMQTQIDVDIQL